jgi:hypothetical protein
MTDVHPARSLNSTPTVILKTVNGLSGSFRLPLDEQLVKNWSGLTELWFEEESPQQSPDRVIRVLAANELASDCTYQNESSIYSYSLLFKQ